MSYITDDHLVFALEKIMVFYISRHCQSISERQAVLQQLASEKSALSAFAESMLAETKAGPSSDSAAASGAQ